MLLKLRLIPAVVSLLAVTALAAPLEVPDALDARQAPAACPTVSRWEAVRVETEYAGTITYTFGVSELGSVTSTTTTTLTLPDVAFTTIYSPGVTTLSATTTTTTVATETTTVTWGTSTETVTSPGYAPSELCKVATFTHTIPGTSTRTDTTTEVEWVFTTRYGHVSTEEVIVYETETYTDVIADSTTYATTVTKPTTATLLDITVATITSTVYARGCQSLVCGL
ncbi:hypothetical protein VTJ49DRAFT_6740 [Mycothermus thermophilus]|uniref:Uncharacterized protein n=1 Tax=Humicola insolens TaxID=85995 RepID=A0ABR3V204_HUMIN